MKHHATSVVLVVGWFVAASALGEEFSIKINRPFTPGSLYDYRARQTVDLFQVVERTGPRETKKTVVSQELSGVVKVAAVDDQGLPTQVFVKVAKLTRELDSDDVQSLVKRDTVIAAEKQEGKVDFRTKTGELSTEAKQALSQLLEDYLFDNDFGDDVIGADDPKGIGDTWGANRQKVKAVLARNGGSVGTGNLHTKMKLEKRARRSGIDCLLLSATIEGIRIQQAMMGHPVTVDTKQTVEMWLPVDPGVPPLGGKSTSTIRTRGGQLIRDPQNGSFHLHVEGEQVLVIHMRPKARKTGR